MKINISNNFSERSQINILYWIQFFHYFATILLMVLLALIFLEEPFNFSTTSIATLVAIYAFTSHAFEPLTSVLVKRIGYKFSLVLSGLLCFCSLALMILFSTYYLCLLFLLLCSFGKALSGLSIRLRISEIHSDEERLLAFGKNYRVINIAAGLGPVVGFSIGYANYVIEIIALAALLYFIGSVLAYVLLNNDKQLENNQKEIYKTSLFEKMSALKNSLIYYLLLMFIVYTCFQISLYPFLLKMEQGVPQYMGYLLAINPFMVIVFQKTITQFYAKSLLQYRDLGYLIGILFNVVAFVIMCVNHTIPYFIAFIVFITLGEMLIYPTIDFSISKNATKIIKPFLLSMCGLVVAFGRTFSEGGGIYVIGKMKELHISMALWWKINLLIATFLFMAFIISFIKMKRSARIKACY